MKLISFAFIASLFTEATSAAEFQKLENSRCRLLLRAYHGNGEEAYCEFKSSILKLSGDDEEAIQAKFLKMFKSGKIQSGISFLSTSGSFVSEERTELNLSNNARNIASLISTPDTSKLKSSSGKLRAAAGRKTVLVIRVITGGGSQIPDADEDTLSDKWFGTSGDTSNAKSQFAACSYNKIQFEPFIGKTDSGVNISNGVYTITISADQYDVSLIEYQAVTTAEAALGNLPSQFDYVALSIPDNDEVWSAYAYYNNWLSLYKPGYVEMVTLQLHEIGHNLGLYHSGEDGYEYGDSSGVMGAAFGDDLSICFNGPKNIQLGWYADREVDAGGGYSGDLYGISDYGSTDSSKKIILVLKRNIIVTFNKATGINSGTAEGADQVLVHSRNPDYTSSLLAKLSPGDVYRTDTPQEIRVTSINNGVATLEITGDGSSCTNKPNWVDSSGDNCGWYEINDEEGCPNNGDLFDGGQGTANEACCHCGGGTSSGTPAPTPSDSTPNPTPNPTPGLTPAPNPTPNPTPSLTPAPTPTSSPPAGCQDVEGWKDSGGDDCSWYEANDTEGCPTFGEIYADESGGTARDNCCYCGGGSDGPSPTPNPTANPTQNPTPGPTPNPVPNPTPNPTPSPTPNPVPNPTPSPTPGSSLPPVGSPSGDTCHEHVNDRFFKTYANGAEKSMSCRSLEMKSQDVIDDWCSRTDVGPTYFAAKDVCTVTCQRCPGGCNERSNSRFYFKTKGDGTVVEKGCQFLEMKKAIWNTDKFVSVCNQDAPEGLENGNTACPITCESCS